MNELTGDQASPAGQGRRFGESPDRRQRHLKSWLCSWYMRRRSGLRRESDSVLNRYVDQHESSIMLVVAATLLLCVADAFLTLFILSFGGEELNPFMDILIKKDVVLFVFVKYLLTTIGLLFAVSHKHFVMFRYVRGYHILYGTCLGYLILIQYEIVLLTTQI